MRNKLISSNKLEGPYDAGVYYLNGKMGLEGMLTTLKGQVTSSETVTLTFPEGYTVPEIINKLSENDVCDKQALISVIQTTDFNYELVADLQASDTIPYRLEGYLFPDTYEFFIDESASSTIKKFLENGNEKYTEKYKKRAKELGYTDYEIMTIASIIQKEAADESQMKIVSSVIHNRLKNSVSYPTLGCDSTSVYISNYVTKVVGLAKGNEYLSYYDTSANKGLPPGPICNPGDDAIKAALYPEETNYYFFLHDSKGKIYLAKNQKEHEANQVQAIRAGGN